MTDDERRKAIEALPDEDTKIVFADGETVMFNFKQEGLRQEAEWDAFKNDPLGKLFLEALEQDP